MLVLRATMIILLQQAGFYDSSIFLLTGPRDMNRPKRYANLRAALGLQQFEAIFSNSDATKPAGRSAVGEYAENTQTVDQPREQQPDMPGSTQAPLCTGSALCLCTDQP